jgi:hypothetical protein
MNSRLATFLNISPSMLTLGGTGDVSSGYFPIYGTMFGGALSILGGS